MPRTSFADIATEWEKLLTTVTNNKDDLQNLETYRSQLEAELTAARAANIRQAAAQAEAQQATRDLEGAIARGRDLALRLRAGITTRYGRRSEKLTEFGMKPFRPGKKKASEAKAPKAESPAKSTRETTARAGETETAPQESTTTGQSQ